MDKKINILAILQARVSSIRLPGKVLKPILGKPLLELQLERENRSQRIDHLIVATSRENSDDGIEELCRLLNVECYRGDLENVLDRFYQAAIKHSPKWIVRLTGDCPLVDPDLIDQIIDFCLKGDFDYATNALQPTYPDGLDVEVFTFKALEEAWRESKLHSQIEHVTPYINRQPEKFKIGHFKGDVDLSYLRWTVDEPADFDLVKCIYENLYPINKNFSTSDILGFLEKFPEWKSYNVMHKRNEGFLKSLQKDKNIDSTWLRTQMKILGIANDETASACLVIDGKIISAASEERFSRIKMDNSWPTKSIEYCLKEGGLGLHEIDKVAYGWSAGFDTEKHFNFYFDRIVDESRFGTDEGLALIKERFNSEVKSDRKKRNEFVDFVHTNKFEKKAIYFDHHECHAYSAFLCSDFSEGLVITSDGRGDFTSFTVSEFTENTLNVLYRATSFDSFGFFYGRITSLLGYTPHRHEGKITGLAAYGDPKKHIQLMREMIYVKEGKVYGKGGKYFKASYKDFSEELLSVIRSAKPEDIAAAAQLHLEESVKEIVAYYLAKTSKKYLCMSGGVFANVRLNQVLLDLPGVENVFVQPHMGDGGLALGAAVAAFSTETNQRPNFQNMFLGPQINIDEKKDVYQKIKEIKTTDIIKVLLEHISQGKVVGLAKGKMEFGPRALCNRSIIYHCKDKSVNQWLNKRMKRTEFMPFAPVTAIDFAQECYVGWNPSQKPSFFMTITYNCTEKMKNSCPAVTHLDGTARPQIIQKETDPFMYELLIRAHKEYGLLSLINTSFNVHEEPIVCNDEDAISGLVDDMVDILLLENKLFIKA